MTAVTQNVQTTTDCHASVQVRLLDEAGEERWDDYVQGNQTATFFHLAGWRRVLERAFGHASYYFVAERDNRVVGVFPLGLVASRLFGKALISTPFCVYGGAVADDDETWRALENAAVDKARELNVDYLEVRNRDSASHDWPGKELYVTFRKELSSDEQENFLAIPRKQRAMVRKGRDAGLVSHNDTDTERFFTAYSESVRNLGTPVFSRRYFEILQEVFGTSCRVLTITHEERLVSSVMSFYFRDEVLPYYAGGGKHARALKANDFMYWEVMRLATEEGIKWFDFGRSKRGVGSFNFKKNWGFEPEPLNYEYFLVQARSVPDINPLNPKYRLFVNAWKRLPLAVSNRLGPLIARNLG